MTNEQLNACLEKVRGGDKSAFEALYNDMKTPVFTVIYRTLHHKERSEDVMHDLFVSLYKSPPDSSVISPRAYLFRMARNLALNSTRRPETEELTGEHADSGEFSEKIARKLDTEEAMMMLPDDEAEIVLFHIYGELKFREIAEMTKSPLGTVLWKYQKAIRKLRTYFNGGTL